MQYAVKAVKGDFRFLYSSSDSGKENPNKVIIFYMIFQNTHDEIFSNITSHKNQTLFTDKPAPARTDKIKTDKRKQIHMHI